MMLQGALPLQLLPAHSSVLPCPRVEQEEESRAGEVQLCRDIHLLCCPPPCQRDSACAARGQGSVKGVFTEARGVFPKSVFACAQEVLAAAYFGLTQEASTRTKVAPSSALFVLREGAFMALL